MPVKTQSPDKHIVSQSNRLIEADYSKAKLPAKTLKVGRLIVSKISPNDKDFRLTRVKNTAIREYLGYKKNVPYNRFNTDLEDICKKLNEQPIRLVTEKGTILNAFLISSWETDWQEDVTVFEISGRLKEHLLELQRNYTTYQLKNIPKLKSSYSIRIYELLSQYRKLGKRRFDLEDFKKKIGCNYDLYGHIKKKAILMAQKELIQHTDLRFEFEDIKKGKKVVAIIFYIYPNEPQASDSTQGVLEFLKDAIETEEKPYLSDNIIERLHVVGISLENIAKYLKLGFTIVQNEKQRKAAISRCKNIETYYLEKLTLLDQSKTTGNNPAGFLIKALREDWQNSKIFQEQKKRKGVQQRKEASKKIVTLEKEKKKLNEQHRILREPLLVTLVNDNKEFMKAYRAVEQKCQGSSFKIIKPHLTPEENYHESILVSSQINLELEKNHPDSFLETRKIMEQVKKIEDQVKALEKSY